MPNVIFPVGAASATYRGLASIYEFVNSDGVHRPFNCGQAAACTALAACEVLPRTAEVEAAHDFMRQVEETHPPDNVGGWFGTSRRRVERILRAHEIPFQAIRGESLLRACLAEQKPVLVMIGTDGARVWKWHAPAGHWIVLYGYDDERVYCTNWNDPGIPWEEFRRRWNGIVPRLISMRGIGLAINQTVPSIS